MVAERSVNLRKFMVTCY